METENYQDDPFIKSLKTFHALQSERIEGYRLFDEGFEAYLKGAPNYNFEMYKTLVAEITKTFSNISKDILAIKKEFDSEHRSIAAIIERIQNLEEEKLQITAQVQMLRQQQIDEERDNLEKLNLNRQRLKELEGSIFEEMENLKYESEDLYQT